MKRILGLTHLSTLGLALATLLAVSSFGGCYFQRGISNFDNDRDGFDETVDCNDDNAAIYPGAFEICGDGVDNDCDGKLDAADPECNNGGTGGAGGSGGAGGNSTVTATGGAGGTTTTTGSGGSGTGGSGTGGSGTGGSGTGGSGTGGSGTGGSGTGGSGTGGSGSGAA